MDKLLTRLADIALGLPFLPFMLVLAALHGPGTRIVIVSRRVAAVAQHRRGSSARQVLSLARTRLGGGGTGHRLSTARIMFVHVLPQGAAALALYGSVAIGWAILAEAAPASWASAIRTPSVGRDAAGRVCHPGARARRWNWFVPPGLAIVLMVLAGFLVTRGSEKLLFPRLEEP